MQQAYIMIWGWFQKKHLCLVHARYTRRNWNMRTNFGHEFHISKQEKNIHTNICPETFNYWIMVRILSWPIGRGGPTVWPPCFRPDFNPPDFSLWKHLKLLVYAVPVDNEEAYRIVDACQTIRNYLGIFARMRRSMMRRVEACISHGGHFEQSL
jgi:hypothetical protein